jgi:transcriptional regulator with XRE-family HTH domain
MAQKPRARADRIDAYVGARIREHRTLKGLSQEELAVELGISHQQVQKYERGSNRVGASRLYHIGQALGTPVSGFFDGLPVPGDDGAAQELSRKQPANDRTSLELIRSYHAVRDLGLKRKIYELVKAAGRV